MSAGKQILGVALASLSTYGLLWLVAVATVGGMP